MENSEDDWGMTEKRIAELENRIINNPNDINALLELQEIYLDINSPFYDKQKSDEIFKRISRLELYKKDNIEELLKIENDEESYSNIGGRTVINSKENVITEDVIKYVKRPRILGILVFIVDIILILFVLSITVLQPVVFRNHDRQIADMTEAPADNVLIPVNELSELDGAYKRDVYSIRRRYVEKSMFNNPGYQPSDVVFGGIQDGKPWYGTENFICYDSTKDAYLRAAGNSYVSRLINNPSFLIGLDLPYVWDSAKFGGKEYKICSNPRMLFIPKKITYSKSLNLITAELDVDSMVIHDDLKYMLNGTNARDLGYKYGYVYNYTNIRFADPEHNASRNLYEFRDYLAVGSSCGIQGGCNNLCPMQEELMFYFGDERWHEFNGSKAIIDFKLWKERPQSVFFRPDMYYRIIFNKRSN